MSSLPPSQAFLNAPDDFLRTTQDKLAPSNGAQSITPIETVSLPDGSSYGGPSQVGRAISTNTRYELKTGIDRSTPESLEDVTAVSAMSPQEDKHQMDYEMHYGVSQRSVKDIVKEILDDIATQKNIHDWDNKLVQTPFKKLENVIRNYLSKCSQEMLNDLLIQSSVEEVGNTGKNPESFPAMQHDGQVQSHLFFLKVGKNFKSFLNIRRLIGEHVDRGKDCF
ncbi:hypothetical protein N0V90_005275 [Kalmusia sp. IMI 367209]|nr:hypothetical protein N0V90_005275 [Kalmusia sp. IMI 367209]